MESFCRWITYKSFQISLDCPSSLIARTIFLPEIVPQLQRLYFEWAPKFLQLAVQYFHQQSL